MDTKPALSRILPRIALCLLALCIAPAGGCKKPSHSRASGAPAVGLTVAVDPREAATATAVPAGPGQDDVVVIGGFGSGGDALADVTIVRSDDTVAPGPALPVGRARHAAVPVEAGARIAVAGGAGGTSADQVPVLGTCLVDPAGDVLDGPALPFALVDPRAVPWDGGTPDDPSDDAVFIIGGRDGSGDPSAAVFRWTLSPAPGTIAQVANLSLPRAGHTATLAGSAGGSLIWVVGGDDGSGPTAAVETIDPATAAVAAGPDLPAGRARHGAAALDGGASVLVAGGIGVDGASIDTAVLLDTAAGTWSDAGRFGPAAFDLAVLALSDRQAAVMGGFTALDGDRPVRPSSEAAFFDLDPATGTGTFIDLPDLDPGNGAGGSAAAVRRGNALGTDGTEGSVVLAGGLSGSGDLRGGRIYNPFGAEAARANDPLVHLGGDRTLVGAALVGIFGVIERTREYYGARLRDIDLERVEDPVRGTVVKGKIGEWKVDLEIDGGMIRGKAAETNFTVDIRGDELRGDGVSVDLRAAPDTSIDGRYYPSWKKNSFLVQVWHLDEDRPFEGRIASYDMNLVIDIAASGMKTESAHSWIDNRTMDLDGSR